MSACDGGSGAPPPVSPRAVLYLLNQMGIREVTAPQLKNFMHDLKKLMYSEMGHSDEFKENTHQNVRRSEGPERLHSCSTISSRSKTVPQNATKSATTRVKGSIILNPQPKSTVTAKQIKKDVPSPETITNEAPKDKNKPTTHRKMRSSKNFIKVPVYENRKKSDPVSLYHQYSTLWQKYKTNLPGENDWADIRWSVREKLLGDKQSQDVRKVPKLSQEQLAKRRDGWIE
ncbi:hyls1 centriolar and ciliogenesis associated [Arctopsyche grandis]|uniref:hyls1 centriolar and ciliogenesis associated n=1 Tax=Arctopsyche grandis TaxID=121162 RepID=UPI00406D7C5B